jgi:hypothetical protein
MELCDAVEGVYVDQIEFEYVDYATYPGDSNGLIVKLYAGRTNPAYKRALNSLFGTDIGDILSATGKVYDDAVRAADEAHVPGTPYAQTGLTVILDLLATLETNELAERVYHRLMINPSFPYRPASSAPANSPASMTWGYLLFRKFAVMH